MPEEALFQGPRSIHDLEDFSRDWLTSKVNGFETNWLLNASENDLMEALTEEFRWDVPALRPSDRYVVEHSEVLRRPNLNFGRSMSQTTPHLKIVIAVPFEGDAQFFSLQADVYLSSPPRASVQELESELQAVFIGEDVTPECISSGVDNLVREVDFYLASHRQAAERWNTSLPELIGQELKRRKERLLGNANLLVALNLPIKKQSSALTYAVKTPQKRLLIDNVASHSTAFQPEPALGEGDYHGILETLGSMAVAMERSPSAFRSLSEEELRFFFLVVLNATYRGAATGETFNFGGKTDILIRVEDRNIFIAECKFWGGEKQLLDTVDQLLGYLSWRDTKAALLIFSRNRRFSEVLTKIEEIVPTHPFFKRTGEKLGETCFRYVLHQPGDPSREVQLAVLAFDVPTQ